MIFHSEGREDCTVKLRKIIMILRPNIIVRKTLFNFCYKSIFRPMPATRSVTSCIVGTLLLYFFFRVCINWGLKFEKWSCVIYFDGRKQKPKMFFDIIIQTERSSAVNRTKWRFLLKITLILLVYSCIRVIQFLLNLFFPFLAPTVICRFKALGFYYYYFKARLG